MSQADQARTYLQNAYAFGSVSEQQIQAAEAALNVQFPPNYKKFLSEYGAACGLGFRLAGLFEPCDPHEPHEWTHVVQCTSRIRRGSRGHMPHPYVFISDDGTDFTFYLDTSRLNSDGECPVIVLGPGRDSLVVATDFWEFVVRLVEDRLEY